MIPRTEIGEIVDARKSKQYNDTMEFIAIAILLILIAVWAFRWKAGRAPSVDEDRPTGNPTDDE